MAGLILRRLWDVATLAILGAGLYQILWWLGAIADLAP